MPTLPPIFRSKSRPSRQEQRRDHDQRRGSARDRGYTHRWDREAALYKRAHPLCLGCEAVGRISATEVVDHPVPHRGDMALFWDPDNRQPACRWHHDVVKARLEALFDKGRIGNADLKLDSAVAMRMTLDLDPR